jgi:putative membrane protein
VPLFVACSSGGSNDATETASAQNRERISEADVTKKQEADAEFLVKATSNALLQVELGKLAQARASTPTVRNYGQRLVKNRLSLLADLRTLAASKQLAIPSALGGDEQEAYHEVSTKTGSQIDKGAMALILKTQKQDENAFDDMKEEAYDGDIRGFAAKHHKTVREELAMAEEINETIEDLP